MLLTLEEFKNDVENGSLIDYDGYGVWWQEGKGEIEKGKKVFPSTFLLESAPSGATHVRWFNR